jgi:hypothetical protein
MSSLKGNLASINGFKGRLRSLPVKLAQSVATRAAPAMTGLTRGAFDGGRTVYGGTRPGGVRGPLTLEQTGATKRNLRFHSVGTVVRCVLGTRWAKFLIGKYEILPNGRLPAEWSDRLRALVSSTPAGDL